MLLSTLFLFALLMSCVDASFLGAGWGFERRVDAAIYRSALKTKVGSQQSEHGIVATHKHLHRSGSCGIERHVRFPESDSESMEQNSQLASNGNDSLIPGLLATSGCENEVPTVEAPSPYRVVEGYGSNTRSADF